MIIISLKNLALGLLIAKEKPHKYFLTYKCSQNHSKLVFACSNSKVYQNGRTTTTETAHADSNPKSAKSSRGARTSRNKRSKARRLNTNKGVASAVKASVMSRLGLDETTELAQLRPASALRTGGVHVNLLGFQENVWIMLRRMNSIAHRPLSNLLTLGNQNIYSSSIYRYCLDRRCSRQDSLRFRQCVEDDWASHCRPV